MEWKSFQLDPNISREETKTTFDYFREKKGFPEAQAQQMITQVTEMGKSAGIEFNFDKALITSTFPAHKLLHLAKQYAKSNEMEEALFIAHFTEGKNMADPETLISLAGSLGIDREEVKQVLASGEFDHEVNNDIQEARNKGISGVPFFILNGKYAVSGAQPVEVFRDALMQTYNETVLPPKNPAEEDKDHSCDQEGCII